MGVLVEPVVSVFKLLLVPGSLPFLLLGLTVGVLLLPWRRLRWLGMIELAMLAALYWILSIPVFADLLSNRFQAGGPHRLDAAEARSADAILVLGAGVVTHSLNGYQASLPDRQTVFNAFEGARVYHSAGREIPVVASGGVVSTDWQREPESVVIRDLLVKAGVPATAIVLDSASKTTHEQTVNLAPMIHARGWRHVVVVAPSVQMPRAVRGFAKEGIQVVPAEAPFTSDVATSRTNSRWLPSGDALMASSRACYDYLAWFYYWMRGWI